jgi:hypothetical protein
MRALIALFALITSICAPAAAQTYSVPIDQAGLLRLPEDATAVVVGNPAIADATMFDARTIFVSGRAYGQTNIIALNSEGRVIYASDVSVTQVRREHVQVFHNNEAVSYVCNPVCRHVPAIGDRPDIFERTLGQRAGVRDEATGAAQNGGNDGN